MLKTHITRIRRRVKVHFMKRAYKMGCFFWWPTYDNPEALSREFDKCKRLIERGCDFANYWAIDWRSVIKTRDNYLIGKNCNTNTTSPHNAAITEATTPIRIHI